MENNISIPVSKPSFIGREMQYVRDCMESGWISSNGKYIESFEKKFAEHIGVRHALSCCNGTAALHLALLALGIGTGDEVIVPTLTYVASANAIQYTGAVPILADADPDTWNIDPSKIESLITKRTRAIMPVHIYGHPCEMDPIKELARKYNIYIIEDSAEAIGAEYNGRRCGSMGTLATFSFYGNKTITTGEGGMVVTNDDDLAAKVRLLKGQGMDVNRRYWFPVIGYNYRMTNIEAALGLAQLENVDEFCGKRRLIAQLYNDNLKDIRGIRQPVEKDYALHSYWMYTILIEDDFGKSRDDVMTMLDRHGVETRPVFYPMHTMPIYHDNSGRFAIAEYVAARGINLPTFYELGDSEIMYIAQLIKGLIT